MIDIERIKQEISIESLIGRSFTVTGTGHTLTTAEHDSLKIFTENNSWAWYSQSGHNGKALGGSVIDWYMHINRCDKATAIRALSDMIEGGAVPPMPRPQVDRKPAAKETAWNDPEWQQNARKRLEAAQDALWSVPSFGSPGNSKGEPGRAYLAKRGIRPDMWVAFGLGFADAWNNKAGKTMPALWVPWQNKRVAAIQYRFIDVAKDNAGADRFGQMRGGTRYLFGLQHCQEAGPGELGTLFLVEGELNAVSIFQSIFGQYAADVLSFGPKNNITAHNAGMIASVASRYRHVVVWADEPADALSALGTIPHAVPVQSPEIDGKRRDANDLLQMSMLDGLIFDIVRYVESKEIKTWIL